MHMKELYVVMLTNFYLNKKLLRHHLIFVHFVSWCFLLIHQDILDEMRKELAKLKEELIDGKYLACGP